MLYAKTIKNHLKAGGKVEDWLEGEPGKCCNGGRYYRVHRFRDGKIISRSSYEDASWEDENVSMDEFVEYVRSTWNDVPYYTVGNRWELT